MCYSKWLKFLLLGIKWIFFFKNLKKLKKNFSFGQIGDGTNVTNRLFSVAVNNLGALLGKSIIQISSGVYHSCVIANDGNSYCWRNE
jgi:alpha-tubulin suppressor-like RCC1 family protein